MKSLLILLLFIFTFSAHAEELPQQEKKKSTKVAEDKPVKKEKKKFNGHFFTFAGMRAPVDQIYGGNFELGYILNRGKFRAYASLLLEHFHFDAKKVNPGDTSGEKLNAAHLGFKGGVIYPIPHALGGIAPFLTIGSVRTSVQKEPWLGERDGAVSLKRTLLAEIGTYFYVKRVALGYHFRYSDSILASTNHFISIGLFY